MAATTHPPVNDAKTDSYLIIDSIQIKNLRGFKNLEIGGLRRINVIAGDSGSGKTALLESIFLVLLCYK